MGLSRSTFYDSAPATLGAGEILARIGAICDEFECYGYRRVGVSVVTRNLADFKQTAFHCSTLGIMPPSGPSEPVRAGMATIWNVEWTNFRDCLLR